MSLFPLIALMLFARGNGRTSTARPAPSPSVVALGTRGVVKLTNKPQIPVVLETVSRQGRTQAVWSVLNLGGSDLGKAQATLSKNVGTTFVVTTTDGNKTLRIRAKWDGFVFVPVA